MRLTETLLSTVNLLALIVLAMPLPRGLFWMRYWVPIALLIAVAQVLVEGPRWQMTPAYALTGLFFLLWLLNLAVTRGSTGLIPISRLATGLGALGLVVSSCCR